MTSQRAKTHLDPGRSDAETLIRVTGRSVGCPGSAPVVEETNLTTRKGTDV